MDSFDEHLLELTEDTSNDNTATTIDEGEEQMEVTTQGDERLQNTSSSVTSTEIQ